MEYYTVRDGLRYDLQCKYKGIAPQTDIPFKSLTKEFPSKNVDWVKLYFQFEEKMNTDYHPNVNLGAALAGDGLLTDHGVEHVKSVIAHAKDIISDSMQLTGYEIYLLLMSIHFHDVGNILGREQHEERIAEIIDEMGDRLSLDTAEKSFIAAIATAHGGYVDGNKDTIRSIDVDTIYDGVQIRCKLLAAILRFADEISDDYRRSEFQNVNVPPENQVYHEYSKALDPISINGETLKLHFRIPYEMTQNKIKKQEKCIFLYDEVLERIAKCMRELEYCKKYAYGFIQLTTIDVTIEFLRKNSTYRWKERSSFRLTLHGYPDKSHSSIWDYLDDTNNTRGGHDGLKFEDGSALCEAMREV